jgi:hypothetical protein
MSGRKSVTGQAMAMVVALALGLGTAVPTQVMAAGKKGSLTLVQKAQFKARKLQLARQQRANQNALAEARTNYDKASKEIFSANARVMNSRANLSVLKQLLDQAETQDRAANTRNGTWNPSKELLRRRDLYDRAQRSHEDGPERAFQEVNARHKVANDRFSKARDDLNAINQQLATRKAEKNAQRAQNLADAQARKLEKRWKNRPPSLAMWGPAPSQSESESGSFSSTSSLRSSGGYLIGDMSERTSISSSSSDRSSRVSDRITDPLPALPSNRSSRVSDRETDPLPTVPGDGNYGRIPQVYVHSNVGPLSGRPLPRSQYVTLPEAPAVAIRRTIYSPFTPLDVAE